MAGIDLLFLLVFVKDLILKYFPNYPVGVINLDELISLVICLDQLLRNRKCSSTKNTIGDDKVPEELMQCNISRLSAEERSCSM